MLLLKTFSRLLFNPSHDENDPSKTKRNETRNIIFFLLVVVSGQVGIAAALFKEGFLLIVNDDEDDGDDDDESDEGDGGSDGNNCSSASGLQGTGAGTGSVPQEKQQEEEEEDGEEEGL